MEHLDVEDIDFTEEAAPTPDLESSRVAPHVALSHAILANLRDVVIVGRLEDGRPYYASSSSDGQLVLVMAKTFVTFMETDVAPTDGA